MIRAGVTVTVLDGIHNKTMIKDDDFIAEGSFNWLSAVRTVGGTHQREERTIIVEGPEAKKMIEEEIKALKKGNAMNVSIKPKTRGNRRKELVRLGGLSALLSSPLALIWYFSDWKFALAFFMLLYLPAFIKGRVNYNESSLLDDSMVNPGFKNLPYNIHHNE